MTRSWSDWWPAGLHDWQGTQTALHLRTQIIGKTRLALAPTQNHWWHATLYVTARGLTTSPMPYDERSLEIDLDFIDHSLNMRTSDGATRTLPLRAQTIAAFFSEYMALLRSLDIEVRIWPQTVEIAEPTRFPDDHRSMPYDRPAVERFFRMLLEADRALKQFRSDFLGKCSPSHFWWGSFDLSCTRFSGRAAPPHPGGIPQLADFVTREAYSHACISAGWWPGTPGGAVEEPSFYAYAYPEPPGCGDVPVQPGAARYDRSLHEWILPHRAVFPVDDPDALVQEFLQFTYGTASRLGAWSPELVRRSEPGDASGTAAVDSVLQVP
jgi:hypothetical protein